MAKISQAELNDLHDAKKLLEALSKDVGASGNALETANGITSTDSAFGGKDALSGHGGDVARFVNARTTRIHEKLGLANQGVGTALGLLTTTISNIETNEKTQRDAANATPAGKSKSSGSPTPSTEGS